MEQSRAEIQISSEDRTNRISLIDWLYRVKGNRQYRLHVSGFSNWMTRQKGRGQKRVGGGEHQFIWTCLCEMFIR